MEVTISNFQEVLAELDDVIKNATFLAIDGEFTGLNSGPEGNAYDTPAQYYSKLRKGSMDFLLVQFGLSVFTYNTQSNKYSQRSYNFYVFPRPFDRSSTDCRFKCQASSISFLVNQGFDFNKLFKLGIPYLTSEEEEKLSKRVEEKQKIRDEGLEVIPISEEDKPQIEDICSRINDFISSEEEELKIDKCNAFVRRLVYQEAKLRWPNKIRLTTKNENGTQFIIASKMGTKEEEEQKEAERRAKEKLEVRQAAGLSILLRKIANSEKLILGHNMLLDLCHIIQQFFCPLPESYVDFKNLVSGLFPRLMDTKIICQSAQFKDLVPSVLDHLLDTLNSPPFSIPEIENVTDRSYSISNKKSHEAGYDAFMTGLGFIALCNRLGSMQKPEVNLVLPGSPLLNPFLNKLLIARLKDYPYIYLTGKDPNPSREHVFHITFPKQWKLSDLSQVFSPYGGAYISWISDTTAYAALHRKDKVSAVIQNLFKSTQYSLIKYRDHQANLESEELLKAEPQRNISEGRKRKSEEMESNEPKKKQCLSSFVNSPIEGENLTLDNIKKEIETQEEWPYFPVTIKGEPDTTEEEEEEEEEEELNKFTRLEAENNILSQEFDEDCQVVGKKNKTEIKRRKFRKNAEQIKLNALPTREIFPLIEIQSSNDTEPFYIEQHNINHDVWKNSQIKLNSNLHSTHSNGESSNTIGLLNKGSNPCSLTPQNDHEQNNVMMHILLNVQQDNKKIKQEIKSINDRLSEISNFLKVEKNISGPIDYQQYDVNVPFATIDEFMSFDLKIQENECLRNELINDLRFLVDKKLSISKSYVNVLKRYFKKDLALQFNAVKKTGDKELLKPTYFCQCVDTIIIAKRKTYNLDTTTTELNQGLSDVLCNVRKWNPKKIEEKY